MESKNHPTPNRKDQNVVGGCWGYARFQVSPGLNWSKRAIFCVFFSAMTTCCSKAVWSWSTNPWCILWPLITKLKICSAQNPNLNSCHVLSTNRHTPCASQGYHSRTLLHWLDGSCNSRTNFICNKRNLGSGSFKILNQKLTCHWSHGQCTPQKEKGLTPSFAFFLDRPLPWARICAWGLTWPNPQAHWLPLPAHQCQ